jgi:DNA-binding NarL/FixJ family response regulator
MVTVRDRQLPCPAVPDVLIATDSRAVYDEVRQVLKGGTTIRWATSGPDALDLCREKAPDLAILDFQIGSMGAIAVTFDLHLEEGAGRLEAIPVLVLLDRRADVYLAERADADGYLVKPLDPIRLRRAVAALLSGGEYADASYKPVTVTPA